MQPLISHIGRATVIVRDEDEALGFYRDLLGLDVLFDGTLPDGTRLVHVGPAHTRTGLWLLRARTPEQHALIGRQTAGLPLLVLNTYDCRGTYLRLRDLGVRFQAPPTETATDVWVHLEDLYGNPIVLVELR